MAENDTHYNEIPEGSLFFRPIFGDDSDFAKHFLK